MILSFDNLPISNDILKGIYFYGLEKPSSLQFDLIDIFLNNTNTLIEKSFYSTEKYESVGIAALQLKGTTMIVVENKKLLNELYEMMQKVNMFLNKEITKNINKISDINLITIDTFNLNYYRLNPSRFKTTTGLPIIFDNVFFLTTNKNTESYCSTFFKDNLTNFFIFTNDMNDTNKYTVFDKYYNNKMNKFEPSQLRHYYIILNSLRDKFNGNCIDNIYETTSIEQSIIYLENSDDVISLNKLLTYKDYPVCCFHENMTIEEQMNEIDLFVSGDRRICICSDKSNLDFIKTLNLVKMNYERITHIIHLDLPKIENYLLRIPFHIETKHIFILDLENTDSFEHKDVLENYFNIKMIKGLTI